MLRVVKAQVEAPPVVNQRDEVGHQPTTGQTARGVAAPTPLVLEFVEAVFRVGSVTIVLGHGDGGIGQLVKRGDQHRDLAAPRGGTSLPALASGVRQVALAVFAATGFAELPDRGDGGRFAHQDDAPFFAPPAETQAGFQRLPAITAVLPDGGLPHHADDEVFDLGGVALLEEIGQAALFMFEHDRLTGVAAVATRKSGPLVARKFFQGLPEAGQAFGSGVFVAGAHLNTKADAQVGNEVAVIDMAGTSRFLRVVADLRPLLASVEGLDGDVDVEDPRHAQRGRDAAEDLARKPVEARFFLDAPDTEPHGVLADGAAHATHGVDMGVTPVAAQDTEQGGAHDVARTAASVACVVQRAVAQKLFPTSTDMKKLEKEDELAFAGDGGLVVPLGMKTPAGSIHRPTARGKLTGSCALTRWVSQNHGRRCFHDPENTSSAAIRRVLHFPL